MSKYYAVKKGFVSGIFKSWKECEQSIKGYSGAKYKSFTSKEDAIQYLNQSTIKINNNEKDSSYGILYTDGASRRNPGHGSFGGVIFNNLNNKICEFYHYLGPKKTNMEAEYHGLCEGLLLAKMIGLTKLDVFVDNQTIVKQLKGEFQCRSENLLDLYNYSLNLSKSFQSFTITHIYRDKNKIADELANISLDNKSTKLIMYNNNMVFTDKDYRFPKY